MAEQTGDFEWSGEGEGAEVVLYAPDDSALERILPAARLPGVESPVYSAASPRTREFGWVAASSSHAAPDLISAPAWGMLFAAGVAVENLGPPGEIPRLISRNLSELRLPTLNEAGVRRTCESGALAAAEDGLIEEEDLAFLDQREGDPDSLGRRAISAGMRDWERLGEFHVYRVGEILDSEKAESLGLEEGALALVVLAGAGDLGRLAVSGHRDRIQARVLGGDFGAEEGLPAAPLDTEEAADLLAATSAAANFAAGRAALLLYALRRAVGDFAGELRPLLSWTLGGFEERDGLLLHRQNLVSAGEGESLVSGSSVVEAAGGMLGSAPPFEAPEQDGGWPWEEAGLLERMGELYSLNR